MKLVVCRSCGDWVRLETMRPRSCQCGKTGGFYEADGLNAVVWGEQALSVAVANPEMDAALLLPELAEPRPVGSWWVLGGPKGNVRRFRSQAEAGLAAGLADLRPRRNP